MKTISWERMISVARRKNWAEGFTSPMSDEQQTASPDSGGVFSISKLSKAPAEIGGQANGVSLCQESLDGANDFHIHRMYREPVLLKNLLLDSKRGAKLKEVTPRSKEGCNSEYFA